MKTTQHFLISGTVQGVGFRRFVEHSAQTLELAGWVRNLRDGRVEAIAIGDAKAMAQFAVLLKKGPNHARVQEVLVREWDAEQEFGDFVIVKDGETPWV